MDLSALSSSSGNLSQSKSMHVSELMEDTSAQVRSLTSASECQPKEKSILICIRFFFSPKRLRLIYTVEAQFDEKYWTISWTFIWALSLQATVQTWHWHQADNICEGYSVKTREGKSLKSLARSPWCLHRTYLRKLRQLGMFVQLPTSSMHTYMPIHTQCIQHSAYIQTYTDIYTVNLT